jgi:hypothetical protein
MRVAFDGRCAAFNLTFEFADAPHVLPVELALIDELQLSG